VKFRSKGDDMRTQSKRMICGVVVATVMLTCLLAIAADEPVIDSKTGLKWYSTVETGYKAAQQGKRKTLLLVHSPDSKMSQYFDKLFAENPDVQKVLKDDYELIRLDFATHTSQAYALHIFKAGTIVLYNVDGAAMRKIDQNLSAYDVMAELGHPVRPANPQAGSQVPVNVSAKSAAAVPAGALLIDDFRSGQVGRNLLGDMCYWGTYCAVRPELKLSITIDAGRPVLQTKGTLPPIPNETFSYGAVWTELTPYHAKTVDLRKYKSLQFRARSKNPAEFKVRIDTPRLGQADLTRVVFKPKAEWQTFTIPLSDFKTGVQDANMITFEAPSEANFKVDLDLSDVMLLP